VGSVRSTPPSRRERLVRDSDGWFTVGAARKRLAHAEHRCVECYQPLARGRAIYCGRVCQWKFHGRFFWDSARIAVLRRDRYTCRACGRRARRRELEVDHILEIARGGAPLSYENLQTLCRPCHRRKTSQFLRSARSGREDLGRQPAGPAPSTEPEWFPA
jgi:5-methylcytosine-specific restriction endonuclease McrA